MSPLEATLEDGNPDAISAPIEFQFGEKLDRLIKYWHGLKTYMENHKTDRHQLYEVRPVYDQFGISGNLHVILGGVVIGGECYMQGTSYRLIMEDNPNFEPCWSVNTMKRQIVKDDFWQEMEVGKTITFKNKRRLETIKDDLMRARMQYPG